MIQKALKQHLSALGELAALLWEEHTAQEMEAEFTELLQDENAALFVLLDEEHTVGFAQCQLRFDYVEGTGTSPVGYLEGIYICSEYRRKGGAKELLTACEEWARSKGCNEFASDCELDNQESLQFHLNVGFREASRNIHFTKEL